MTKFDFKLWKSQVRERFSSAESIDALLQAHEQLLAETEELINQDEDGDRSLIACHAGCQDCCIVNVSVTFIEALAILRFIRQWGDDQHAEIVSKLDSLWRVVRGLEDDERIMVRKKCAFLDATGCCTIYPVRPLFCRGVTSVDAAACRAAIAEQAFGTTAEVMMHQFQLDLYGDAFSAVSEGLERAGLDGRGFQLCGIIRFLLNHPGQEDDLMRSSSLSWKDLYR